MDRQNWIKKTLRVLAIITAIVVTATVYLNIGRVMGTYYHGALLTNSQTGFCEFLNGPHKIFAPSYSDIPDLQITSAFLWPIMLVEAGAIWLLYSIPHALLWLVFSGNIEGVSMAEMPLMVVFALATFIYLFIRHSADTLGGGNS
jgi:hypothetical protein